MVGKRFKHSAEESRGGQTDGCKNESERRKTIENNREHQYASKKAKRKKKKANVKERQTAVDVVVGVQERHTAVETQ